MQTSKPNAGLSILQVESKDLKFPQAPKYQRAFEVLQPIIIEKFENLSDKAGMPYLEHLDTVCNNVLRMFNFGQLKFLEEDFKIYSEDKDPSDAIEAYVIKISIVAWCHDLIEDTDVTVEDLKELNIPNYLINAIELLTKSDNCKPNTKEEDLYFEKIKELPLARAVKIADLLHNMDLQRLMLKGIKPKDIERTKRYADRLAFLMD